ncbi:MAG: hypothetical protein HY263_05785 [Chloroflexi bacterium]|nr:hypothetical protein [Chloroflexota bacterium]
MQIRRLLASGAVTTVFIASVPVVAADSATVTRGEFQAFAAGTGLDISGRAQMVRTADGTTIVTIHLEGLAGETTYGSHVHKQACADGDADGHYKLDAAGPATPPNEIWPGPFTTTASGIGNGNVTVPYTAGPTAMSVVVHAPGSAKIACADLQ